MIHAARDHPVVCRHDESKRGHLGRHRALHGVSFAGHQPMCREGLSGAGAERQRHEGGQGRLSAGERHPIWWSLLWLAWPGRSGRNPAIDVSSIS